VFFEVNYGLILSLQAKSMRTQKNRLSSFSQALKTDALCLRPENEQELLEYLKHEHPKSLIARGAGLSYNDSCLNHQGHVIDTSRFNHLIEFNPDSGLLICQGNVTLRDLFLIHPQFTPFVMPGTIHATIAGCIAHDIHGKNNHLAASFGQHILWIELLVHNHIIRCSREAHTDLFHATIAGAGLTGIITRVALCLNQSSHCVQTDNHSFESLQTLIEYMSCDGINNDYQVAWIDLSHTAPRAIVSVANHTKRVLHKVEHALTIPKLPFRAIYPWMMKWFNDAYFKRKRKNQEVHLELFNNPLDGIRHWNRLYGSKGLIQFQAVFDTSCAVGIIEHLITLMKLHKVTPILSVLKLFTKAGMGYLSFCTPGTTLAIDFVNNQAAQNAIKAMNAYLTEIKGRVYLAKDFLLRPEQFKLMYQNHEQFEEVLQKYQCCMHSDFSQRLGITSL
jgi:decaprenylphospho-beta-D-ribofuranose 2-oxidase